MLAPRVLNLKLQIQNFLEWKLLSYSAHSYLPGNIIMEEFYEHCLFISDWPLLMLPWARQLASQRFNEVASGAMLTEQLSHEHVQHLSIMLRMAAHSLVFIWWPSENYNTQFILSAYSPYLKVASRNEAQNITYKKNKQNISSCCVFPF